MSSIPTALTVQRVTGVLRAAGFSSATKDQIGYRVKKIRNVIYVWEVYPTALVEIDGEASQQRFAAYADALQRAGLDVRLGSGQLVLPISPDVKLLHSARP